MRAGGAGSRAWQGTRAAALPAGSHRTGLTCREAKAQGAIPQSLQRWCKRCSQHMGCSSAPKTRHDPWGNLARWAACPPSALRLPPPVPHPLHIFLVQGVVHDESAA